VNKQALMKAQDKVIMTRDFQDLNSEEKIMFLKLSESIIMEYLNALSQLITRDAEEPLN